MIGGETGTPAWKSTGPGTPMPTPAGRSTPCSASSLRASSMASASTGSGPRRMSAVGTPSAGEHAEPAVRDRDAHRGRAQLDADEAQSGVEVDERGSPPTPRRRRPSVLGQPELDQPPDLGGDRGPGDVQTRCQVHARQRALVAHVGQDPRLCGRLGSAGQNVRHVRILPRVSTDFRNLVAEWRPHSCSRRPGWPYPGIAFSAVSSAGAKVPGSSRDRAGSSFRRLRSAVAATARARLNRSSEGRSQPWQRLTLGAG